MIARVAGVLGLGVAGVVIGVLGAFVQAHRALVELPWGTLTVPWGLALVWIALLAGIRGGAWAIGSRWGAWAVLGGWLVATVALSAESPSGDLALSGGGRQLAYLLGGVIMGSAAATLRVPRRVNAGQEPSGEQGRL
ncbi:MAG: DUF6113 family protein [Actinomycetota bacterium]|nr:DUF6113 family protein [Actinomycetota bacterium]